MLLSTEMTSVFAAAEEGIRGLGAVSEAAPKDFHRMVLLGEIVNVGRAVMELGLAGGGTVSGGLNCMCMMSKGPVELAAQNTQGMFVPPITGTVETLWLWLTVAIEPLGAVMYE